MKIKQFDIEEYKAYLAELSRSELLTLLYTVKRPKEPIKHQLIEEAFSAKIQPNKEAVQAWANTLPGSKIRLQGYRDPVTIKTAQVNGPATAAIVTIEIEGQVITKYLKYKGEQK